MENVSIKTMQATVEIWREALDRALLAKTKALADLDEARAEISRLKEKIEGLELGNTAFTDEFAALMAENSRLKARLNMPRKAKMPGRGKCPP